MGNIIYTNVEDNIQKKEHKYSERKISNKGFHEGCISQFKITSKISTVFFQAMVFYFYSTCDFRLLFVLSSLYKKHQLSSMDFKTFIYYLQTSEVDIEMWAETRYDY